MPEIAATQTAADMAYAKPHEFMPSGVENRRAARMQAAALRWLVRMAVLLTAGVLVFLIGHVFNIGVNLIGTYVHAARLQYLEYFGKFYKEGGIPFRPLQYDTKYVDINDEEEN